MIATHGSSNVLSGTQCRPTPSLFYNFSNILTDLMLSDQEGLRCSKIYFNLLKVITRVSLECMGHACEVKEVLLVCNIAQRNITFSV